jgi:hypothetical protein
MLIRYATSEQRKYIKRMSSLNDDHDDGAIDRVAAAR